MEVEKPLTCRSIARMFGVSEEFVRSACHRASSNHRLPHTASGSKRPVRLIRPSVFKTWYEEEEAIAR